MPSCLSALIAAALIASSAASAPAMDADERAKAKTELAKTAQEVSRLSHAFNLIHEIAAPSVVSIHTSERVRSRVFGVGEVAIGEGSGFVFRSGDKESYVLTNAHVVVQTNQDQFVFQNGRPVVYNRITVVLGDSREIDADCVGADTKTDMAVLKVPVPNLPAVEWADSEQARVGDWVLALGYPFGVGYSATSGIISATDRSTGIYRDNGGFESFIQTDAAINPGNSGGPLFTLEGRVIGVNSNILSKTGANIGIGFAIPSTLAHRVADEIVEHGHVIWPIIGISLDELDAQQAQANGLAAIPSVLVGKIFPGGPAEKAGMQEGDVILAVNTVRIHSSQHFRARVAMGKVGEAIELRVARKGKEQALRVVPVAEGTLGNRQMAAKQPLAGFGMLLAEDGKTGVIVAQVEADSLAHEAGLVPGDRILGERSAGAVHTLDDLDRLSGRREVVLNVLYSRDGRSEWLRLRR